METSKGSLVYNTERSLVESVVKATVNSNSSYLHKHGFLYL